MAIKTDIATKNIVSKINSILKHTSNSKTQFYTFCDEMIKQHPEIAKQMRVAVIEHRDIENHVIEPLNRIVIELKTENGQKQICYFALNGENATINNVDDDHKIVWKLPLARYLNLYDNMDKVEERLLKYSSTDDLIIEKTNNIPNENQTLSAQEIKKDISTLARLLIRAYVGWPHHDITTKIAVLDRLESLYSEDQEMTIKEFKNKIGCIPSFIPDNHLTIVYGRPRLGGMTNRVGANIADDDKIVLKKENNIVIIGLRSMDKKRTLTDDQKQLLTSMPNWAQNNLKNSIALIVDMRHCAGGSDKETNNLAKYLCGNVLIDPAKAEYIRINDDVKKILQKEKIKEYLDKDGNPIADTDNYKLWERTKENSKINTEQAYMKPIYILTDKRAGSSAERFLLSMRKHPMVRFVGENSGGTEVYGSVSQDVYLPNSNLFIRVGLHYRSLDREVGHDRYELHGLKPDIKCREGEDAMQVALKDIENKQYTANFEQAATKIEQSMATIKTNRLKKEEKTL